MTDPNLEASLSRLIRSASVFTPPPDVDAAWTNVQRRLADGPVQLPASRPTKVSGPWTARIAIAAAGIALVAAAGTSLNRQPDATTTDTRTPSLEQPVAAADLFAADFPKEWTVTARLDGDSLCVGTRVEGPSGSGVGEGCGLFPDGRRPEVSYGVKSFPNPMPSGLTTPIADSAIFSVAIAEGHSVLIRPSGSPESAWTDLATLPGLHADDFDLAGTRVTVYSGVLLNGATPISSGPRVPPLELAWG